jgi:hypothetical protein
MESQQTGLLERLRAQRENMQSSMAPTLATDDIPSPPSPGEMSIPTGMDGIPPPSDAPRPMPMPTGTSFSASDIATAVERSPVIDDIGRRIGRVESGNDEVRRRLETVEATLRSGLQELRTELPGIVTAEVSRHMQPTTDAVTELGGRLGRVETDFSRERERWSNVITTFDQRLDHRLRSFRQDVTVMLTGMAVLVLAMLMLILLRR